MFVRALRISAAIGTVLVLAGSVNAQPTGRLLVPGPTDGGIALNEIHEYDLATGVMTTFPAGYVVPPTSYGVKYGTGTV